MPPCTAVSKQDSTQPPWSPWCSAQTSNSSLIYICELYILTLGSCFQKYYFHYMGLMNFDSFAVVFCFYFYCMEHTRTLWILTLLLLWYVSILWNLQIDTSCNCKLFHNYLSFYFWLLSIEPKDWASRPWCSFEVSKYLMNLNSFKWQSTICKI